jgi:hypothetical protein
LIPLTERIAAHLAEYERTDNLGAFLDAMRSLSESADADALVQAAEPYRERLEVVIPIYERVVALRPGDARAMVTLANAYWLTGRGPDVVGELAERARAADPQNRAAWHLWALSESDVRSRTDRWRQVSEAFPADQLALDLAIATYEGLLKESISPTQTRALQQTLETLRSWKL